jgi:hypothetical protein
MVYAATNANTINDIMMEQYEIILDVADGIPINESEGTALFTCEFNNPCNGILLYWIFNITILMLLFLILVCQSQ